jgi:tRNA dimethylallyltransferase
MDKPTLILIGGATASGKSALALEIARRESGTIINADAMQVYAGLPVLTAQPPRSIQHSAFSIQGRAIPHELYEVFDPAEKSSAGRWLDLAKEAIERAVESGRKPIVVGGTGLYFKALLEGIAEIPPIPQDVRAESKKLYDALGSEVFRSALAKLDPESAAKIKPNDRQRLIRAYEVVRHTGKTLGAWQKTQRPASFRGELDPETGASENPESRLFKKEQNQTGFRINFLSSKDEKKIVRDDEFKIVRHLLLPPREELYAACDARFLRMMERGAVEEVKALMAQGLDPELPAMKILGVREIAAYLRGDVSREEAIAKAQQATRNYAKRQVTWFRGQWKDGENSNFPIV